MTVTIKNLATYELTTSTGAAYTSPTNTRTRITHCNIVNYSGGAVTFGAFRVNSGDVAGNDNRLVNGKSIAAGGSDQCPEIVGLVLDAGDSLHLAASGNSALVANISGQQVT